MCLEKALESIAEPANNSKNCRSLVPAFFYFFVIRTIPSLCIYIYICTDIPETIQIILDAETVHTLYWGTFRPLSQYIYIYKCFRVRVCTHISYYNCLIYTHMYTYIYICMYRCTLYTRVKFEATQALGKLHVGSTSGKRLSFGPHSGPAESWASRA